MIHKTRNLRMLAPGQWAQVIVPDLDCWKAGAAGYWKAEVGNVVDICIMPLYGPRYDSKNCFHWSYRVAYRHLLSSWPNHSSREGGCIAPWDFNLKESYYYHYNSAEYKEHYEGKGKWLYEPASEDHGLCPGPDCSTYRCDLCEKTVQPFSDDEGNLICPWCEASGLVILDEEQLDQLEKVREFARQVGLSHQLEHQLSFLGCARSWGSKSQCVLSYDFAPHSFCFAHFILPEAAKSGERTLSLHGGLIYQGPTSPADGSFPSLSVSLDPGRSGWFCHT